jgi:2-oxoisovalerate dehydrogenase E1 component
LSLTPAPFSIPGWMTTTDTPSPTIAKSSLSGRFAAFVAERFPFALGAATAAFHRAAREGAEWTDASAIEQLRDSLRAMLTDSLGQHASLGTIRRDEVPETTPRVSIDQRLSAAATELIEACDGFLRREAIGASLTRDEKRAMLRGMIVTRATDNRLKSFFSGGEVRYGATSFQGKGFRSLGQEAIYAAPLRLRRGAAFREADGSWKGDVVSPMIRDLGAALSMRPEMESVRMVLSSQMGKAGPPMNGKDLHVGDFSWGILPPTAPLAMPALTIAGLAMSFWYSDRLASLAADNAQRPADSAPPSMRVAVSFIGEGGSSLGEWHEAINLCAARRLPAVFCIENNQTALSTPVDEQSAVRVFADKAAGYGIPALTVDGTDPEAIASAFTWAVERARRGDGPALIELVAMRMCGHAHHDDMLYLGKEPSTSWDYPQLSEGGYADRETWDFWCVRDPIASYSSKLEAAGIVDPGEVSRWKDEADRAVDAEARKVIDAPWPEGSDAGKNVFADQPALARVEVLDEAIRSAPFGATLPEIESAPPFDPRGRTFLEAVMLGVGDALRSDPRVFVFGEDVGGKYGNAFLLLRPLIKEFGPRIINSTLAEGAVLGVCVGSALGGLRPIGEIQFNDFVASGFNMLVNNAAKIRYRWGGEVPMVLRMPWGGLRHAGPYHSQNTEAWFYRTPGLKIVAPSTPHDARALMAAAVADRDPVLYYEHIALYRDPKIKQVLPDEAPTAIPLGQAALRRAGSDLAIISYGAYVHVGMRVAEKLAVDGIESSVLDLRSLVPLDRETLLSVVRHCSRVLIIEEDTRTGSIGESLASIIQEEAFEWLDAPVRIIGALDTPVPYSPPLEEFFLASEEQIERAARLLVAY